MFNFKETESAKESSYLKPGVYPVKITKGEKGLTKTSSTPYVGLTFTTDNGLAITENFMITDKAISRLQYLHEAYTNKKLDKVFKSADEVADYFIKQFSTGKGATIVKRVIVGGEVNGKITYGNLPYTAFVDVDNKYEDGEFEEGSDEWNKFVRKSNRATEATNKGQGILNNVDDDDDDAPEVEDKKATTTKKTTAATANSKKTTVKAEKEEAEDEDTPW